MSCPHMIVELAPSVAPRPTCVARYSVLSEYNQLFAAKYLTYLPTEEELQRELERDRRLAEAIVEAPRAEHPTKTKPTTRAKGRKK